MNVNMMPGTTLSILVVSWNTKDLLRNCLQSIYGSVKGISFEVIVVDNHSADGSPEMVKKHFAAATLIENQENVGFARGSNQAYAAAKGRIIGLLNSDTIVYPGAFEKMVEYLDSHRGVGAVSCKLLNLDGSLQREMFRRFPTVRSVFFRYTALGQLMNDRLCQGRALDAFFYTEKTFSDTETIQQPGASCLVLPRFLIEDIGLFDEQFPLFFNDVDLCKRIWSKGREIHVLSDACITHIGGASVKQLPQGRGAEIARLGMYRYFRKHHGLVHALVVYLMVSGDRWLSGRGERESSGRGPEDQR